MLRNGKKKERRLKARTGGRKKGTKEEWTERRHEGKKDMNEGK